MKFLALLALLALMLNNQFRGEYGNAVLLHASLQLLLALVFAGALLAAIRQELDSLLFP